MTLPLARPPRLVREAPARELIGNQPLPLDAPGTAWLVEEGRVELFVVDRRRGGRRRHVVTVAPGGLVFAVAASGPLSLAMVAVREARLREVPLAELRAAKRDPEVEDWLISSVEAWVERLLEGGLETVPPKVFETLRAGGELALEPDEVARPSRLVWVRHVEGACRFLGLDELVLERSEALVPLAGRAWLEAARPALLSCVDTVVMVRGGAVWEGLERFHSLFLRAFDLQQEAGEAREWELFARHGELDRQRLEVASRRLASVLGVEPPGAAAVETAVEPLLGACRLVGRALGLEVVAPPEAAAESRDRLARIAGASGLRHRRVILRDDWWRHDNGPLVASRLETDDPRGPSRPVALLPRHDDGYDLVEPATGERERVDRALAERLDGVAWMFYPPLPTRPARARDLLRMGMRDGGPDLQRLLVVGLGAGALALLVPIVTGQIFGHVIPSADRSMLLQMVAALVVAAAATAAFQLVRGLTVLRLGSRIDGSAQAAVFDRLLRLPVSFFRGYTVGDLAERSMGIDRIRDLLAGNLVSALLAAVFSVFSFGLLFYYSWRLALVSTALVSMVAVVTLGLVWLQVRKQRLLLRVQGQISSLLFGLIRGITKLRIAGAESRAYALWAERFAEQRRRAIEARHLANVQSTFNAVYAVAASLTLFAVVGFKLQEQMPLADFLAFSAAFGQFQGAVLSTVGLLSGGLAMVPLYERLTPILTTRPEVDETKIEAPDLQGDVELGHVSFRYREDGPLILDDVSLRARPGEFVALVGPSGSGKSTCLRLLLGFEEPESGSIYFDGMDLPSLDLRSVRRQIGVVLQGGQPIAGDFFSNIVGSSNLTLDDAWEAARMAGLEEDVRAMPMGMHTVVSEGGGTLSGGQIQRLLIARAIVHRPRIVLFDEATSALDNRTQAVVSRSLEQLKATRIVVAHRLSTIAGADRIYLLDKGRVREEGTFSELVARGELFARLVERQTV